VHYAGKTFYISVHKVALLLQKTSQIFLYEFFTKSEAINIIIIVRYTFHYTKIIL